MTVDAARANTAGGVSTTVESWLAGLKPAPPLALAKRLTELLEPYRSWPATRVSDACEEAGERLLNGLLTSGATTRGSALDLLAVDALVTYAFEASADAPDEIERRSALAMQRISALPRVSRE